MLRLFIIPLMLLLAISEALAQVKSWSLDECIQYAKERNVDIKSKRLDIETSKTNLSESKWAYAPSLSANNSYNVSQGRVLDPTTYEFIENQTVGGNSTSVSASMVLFDGLRNLNTVKREKLNLNSAILGVEKAENDLMLNVTAYYLEILLAKENIANYEQVEESLTTQRDNVAKMVEVGKVTTADLLQVESQLADAKTNLLTAKNQLYIAKLNICQLLEIEDYMSFETAEADSMLATPLVSLHSVDDILQSAESLPELESARLAIDIKKRDLNIARSQYYPSISLSASYGSSYSSVRQKSFQNPDGTFKYEAYSFAEQYKDNLNGYLSVGISIPIFNRFSTLKSVQRTKIAIHQAEYSLHSMEKQVNKEVNQAYIDMNIAWEKYNSTRLYLTSSAEAVRQIEKKYSVGVATIVDYNTAMNNYIDASSKHSQAKYEYIFKTRIIQFYMSYLKQNSRFKYN